MAASGLSKSWAVQVLLKWVWVIGFLPIGLDFLSTYIPLQWIPPGIAALIAQLPSPAATLVLFATGLLASAYLVHRDTTAQVAAIIADRASLALVPIDAVFIHDEPILTNEGRFEDGLKPNGLPVQAVAGAQIEIHNLGIEDGELEWNLDYTKSSLPPVFFVFGSEPDGRMVGVPASIPGRTRVKASWRLECGISQGDPEAFAKDLAAEDTFTLVIQYRTLRVGEPSVFQFAHLEGSMQPYRNRLAEKWQAKGLGNLVRLMMHEAA